MLLGMWYMKNPWITVYFSVINKSTGRDIDRLTSLECRGHAAPLLLSRTTQRFPSSKHLLWALAVPCPRWMVSHVIEAFTLLGEPVAMTLVGGQPLQIQWPRSYRPPGIVQQHIHWNSMCSLFHPLPCSLVFRSLAGHTDQAHGLPLHLQGTPGSWGYGSGHGGHFGPQLPLHIGKPH